MGAERTVKELAAKIEHVAGVKIRIGWIPFHGLSLRDTETGNQYALGMVSKRGILSSCEQETVCRGLHREEWIVLLACWA